MIEVATTDTYFHEYYRTHKEQLSEKRKQRYSEDEEYRRKCIERAKARYSEKREEIREKNRRSPFVVWADGRRKPEAALLLSDLAEQIDKAAFTIRWWIREGMIQDTPIRRGGVRIYTQRMIDVVRKALPTTFRKDWDKTRAKIQKGWERVGAFEAGVEVKSL
jgi:hypothetical protein